MSDRERPMLPGQVIGLHALQFALELGCEQRARDRGMDDAVDMWRPPDMSPKEHKRRVAACLSDDHIRFLHRARYFAKEYGADTLYFDDRIRRLEPPEPKYRHAGCDGGH